MRRKASLFAGLGLASLLSLAPIKGIEHIVNNADANVLVVGGGSGEYPTLQSAINAAAPSDTVLARDRVFGRSENPLYVEYFPIIIDGNTQAHGGNLTIMSEHGRDYTEMENWDGAYILVSIQNVGDGLLLKGFSIDGQFSPSTDSGGLVGIDIRYASPIISECSIFNSEKTIYGLDSDFTLQDSDVITVYAPSGRGVVASNYSNPTISRNHFMFGQGTLPSFTYFVEPAIHLATDLTTTPELNSNIFDGPPETSLTPALWEAIRVYGPIGFSAENETITPYATEIDFLRTYGTLEEQANYNCPAITDYHDDPSLGFVDLFGIQTSVESPYSTPSSWGGLKTEYKSK